MHQSPAPEKQAGRTTRRRLRWIVLIIVVVLAGSYLLRAPLLRLAACCMVREDPEEACAALVVVGSDDYTPEAARLYQAGLAPTVLVIERTPDRLVSSGVLDPEETRRTQLLVYRGVPRSAIQVIPGPADTKWEAARSLRPWLEAHPQARIRVLCEQLESRKISIIFKAVLGPELFARVAWGPVRSQWYNENDWWTTRIGVQSFFRHASGLGYVLVQGEDRNEGLPRDADQYERIVCPSLP